MTQSKTTTIETPHGKVSYTTVDCASCGSEVKEDMAADYLVGKLKGKPTHFGVQHYSFDDGTLQRGHLCPYCVDTGPMNTPGSPSIHAEVVRRIRTTDVADLGFFIFIFFAGLSLLVMTVGAVLVGI